MSSPSLTKSEVTADCLLFNFSDEKQFFIQNAASLFKVNQIYFLHIFQYFRSQANLQHVEELVFLFVFFYVCLFYGVFVFVVFCFVVCCTVFLLNFIQVVFSFSRLCFALKLWFARCFEYGCGLDNFSMFNLR